MILATQNNLDVSRLSPKWGDKYSLNLYRWLTAQGRRAYAEYSRVYKDTNGTLWIGILQDKELFGSHLMGVLCNGAQEGTAAHQRVDAQEVPDFWDNYISIGRCAVDTEHSTNFVNAESRWRTRGDRRFCEWCHKASQTLKRWSETIPCEGWVNDPVEAAPTHPECALDDPKFREQVQALKNVSAAINGTTPTPVKFSEDAKPAARMTSAEYVAHGGDKCPECHGSDVESGALQADGNVAWSPVKCYSCHFEWRDEYQLTGYGAIPA